MELGLQITARNFKIPDYIREDISGKAAKLDKFYDRIIRCRVVVETPHRHKTEGILYNVRIDMKVPGAELVVKREPNEDIEVAIRDAFDAARRQLEDFVRKQRQDVKRHEEPPHAVINALFPEKGYGFLTTTDNREIYFHKNSLLKYDFNKLKTGMNVRFTEEMGDKGPQASTVTVV